MDPLADVEQAITPELRQELGIANIIEERPRLIRFRFGPGIAYERIARVAYLPQGEHLTLWQQYQPRDEMTWMGTGKQFSPSALREDLRDFRHHADTRDNRPFWRKLADRQVPEWEHRIPAASDGALIDAWRRAAARAADAGRPCFVWRDAVDYVCGSDPPPGRAVDSVNHLGQWALHTATRTVLTETPPDRQSWALRADAARLAAQDLGAGTAAIGCPAESEVPGPAVSPAVAARQSRGR
jgi:hypothetical protein